MTLDEYLADLAAKAEKATPGPWLTRCVCSSVGLEYSGYADVVTKADGRSFTVDNQQVRNGDVLRRDLGSGYVEETLINKRTERPSPQADAAHIAAFAPDVAAALVAVAKAAHEYLAKPHIGAEAEETGMRAALSRLTALARTR